MASSGVRKTGRIVRKTVHAPGGWTDALWGQAIAFWQGRGFTFLHDSRADLRVGHRGSLWGNLTSFDMSKLHALLTITRLSETEVEFAMDIDTTFQVITEDNDTYWNLELATAESWLLYGDRQEEAWRQLQARTRKKVLVWPSSRKKSPR